MARPHQLDGENICYHIMARCNNAAHFFKQDLACSLFLSVCEHYRKKYKFSLHAYTIMHNHVHMMLTTSKISISMIMNSLCSVFSHDYNIKCNRVGHFWRRPYKAKVIDSDIYALTCLRYIHDNPVRAHLVETPEQWKWSSHNFYLTEKQKQNIELTPLEAFLSFSNSNSQRKKAYKNMFEYHTDQELELKLFEGKVKANSRRTQQYFNKLTKKRSPVFGK